MLDPFCLPKLATLAPSRAPLALHRDVTRSHLYLCLAPPLRGNLEAYEGHFHRAKLPYQAKLVVDPCGHCQDAAAAFPHDTVFGRVILPILMGLDLIRDDNPNNSTYPAPPEGVKNVTIYVMSRWVRKWGGAGACGAVLL